MNDQARVACGLAGSVAEGGQELKIYAARLDAWQIGCAARATPVRVVEDPPDMRLNTPEPMKVVKMH